MFTAFFKKEFFEYLKVFTWREIKIKYAQTFVGIFWMFFPPLMGIIVSYFFLDKLLRAGKEIPNYTLFAYCGMMGWYYFSYLVSYTSISLLQNVDLISKTTIPRIIIPLAKSITGLIDTLIWVIFAIILKIIFLKNFNISLILIIFPLLLNFISGFSIGLWLSIFSIKWRDIYQLLPYIIGLGMLGTPVVYHANMIPENIKFIYYFNPIAAVIEMYRKYILNIHIDIIKFTPAIIIAIILFLTGIYSFLKQETKLSEKL
jgi:lipopolysaccharide transport system permease protein